MELRSAKRAGQNDSGAAPHDRVGGKKRQVVKNVTEERWKYSKILFHMWLKRQLLFIVSAMPGPVRTETQ